MTATLNPVSQQSRQTPIMAKALAMATLTPYYQRHPLSQGKPAQVGYVAGKTLVNLLPVAGGAMLAAKYSALLHPIVSERLFLLAGLGVVAIKEWVELLANPSQRQWLGEWLQQAGAQQPGEKLWGIIPRRTTHILESPAAWKRQAYKGIKGLGYLVPFGFATKLAWPLGPQMAIPVGLLSGLGTDGVREWVTMTWNKNQRRLVGQWLSQSVK